MESRNRMFKRINAKSDATLAVGDAKADRPNKHLTVLFLLAALVAQTFASGRLAVTPAVWGAPLLLLVFLDRMPNGRGLMLVFSCTFMAFLVQALWQDLPRISMPPMLTVGCGLPQSSCSRRSSSVAQLHLRRRLPCVAENPPDLRY
jgi:hypothetical protein